MLGLALEGGGARGAYHIGAYKAFAEAGYEFDAITGTSIGAMNAAMLAQGSFDEALNAWENMSNSDVFDIEDKRVKKIFDGKMEVPDLSYYFDVITRVTTDGGVDTAKMVELIDKMVDADRLFNSPVNFGLVSVCASDHKPVELFKGDMTRENVKSYIMASATFPGFQPTVIDGKRYFDGGVFDNCPMTMLQRLGCDRIIGVRTFGPGIYRVPSDPNLEISVIEPSESLGMIMNFEPEIAKKNIELGYYDALRYIEGLKGSKYYIGEIKRGESMKMLLRLTDEQIAAACNIAGTGTEMFAKRALLEKLLPLISETISVKKDADYTDLLIAMMENKAERAKVERLKKYSFHDFFVNVAQANSEPPKFLPILQSTKVKVAAAIDCLLENMYQNSLD